MIWQKIKKNKENRAFVILYAVTLAAIVLSIALGVANIALREIKFGTSARDANDAFFAADTGIECALFYDRSEDADNAFIGTASMNCAGSSTITPIEDPPSYWTFVIPGLGTNGQGCSKVTVDKRVLPDTSVVAKGYNIGNVSCDSSNPNSVERQLEIFY